MPRLRRRIELLQLITVRSWQNEMVKKITAINRTPHNMRNISLLGT